MSVNVTFNNQSYTIPEARETGWAAQVTSWIQGVSQGALSKAGGSFTLTADADFGAGFGLKSTYYKTRDANLATSGQFRLGYTELVAWRNSTNTGNNILGINSSDELTYNGNPISLSAAFAASRALVTNGSGIITTSTTTAAEVGHVNGVTGAIQTQLNTLTNNVSTNTTSIATNTTNIALREPRQNFLINSDFQYWQRGTSTTVANGSSTYLCDRWYVTNTLGTNGVITYSRNSTANTPSQYALQAQITTAPTASQANGCAVYQTLENIDSRALYNQTASFGLYVKALGNVNQVGVQFFYKTTEGKVDTSIGSEQTVTVTTGAFALAKIDGQALGTTQTTSGVIGVRIRITAVSSGNAYDLNNGFILSQAMLNIGSAMQAFQTRGRGATEELELCRRYYQKSYQVGTAPRSSTSVGTYIQRANSNGDIMAIFALKPEMFKIPTVTFIDPGGSQSEGFWRNFNTNNPIAMSLYDSGSGTSNGVFCGGNAVSQTGNNLLGGHWTADAEI